MKIIHRLAILSVLLGGCAGTIAPATHVASARAAIRSAREVGAEHTPTAALYLRYAREEYTLGDRLSLRGHDVQASRAMERSEADAELSMELARGASARAAADQAANRQASFRPLTTLTVQ